MADWPSAAEQQWLREQGYKAEDKLLEEFGDMKWESWGPSPTIAELVAGEGRNFYKSGDYDIRRAPGKGWHLIWTDQGDRVGLGYFDSLSDAQRKAWAHVKSLKVHKHLQGRHDQRSHGRYRGGSKQGPSLSKPMAEELEADTRTEGGTTYSVANKSSPIKGMVLSVYEKRTQSYSVEEFDHDSLIAFSRKNADLLAKDGHYLGTWVDSETGNVVLDVVIVVGTHEEAVRLGSQHDQDAYWDLGAKKEIRLKKPRRRAA